VVEHLPSKLKALSPNPNSPHRKKERQRETERETEREYEARTRMTVMEMEEIFQHGARHQWLPPVILETLS
jgi:hypothetical protein